MKVADSLETSLVSYFSWQMKPFIYKILFWLRGFSCLLNHSLLTLPAYTAVLNHDSVICHKIIIHIYRVILGGEIHPGKSCSHVSTNYSAFLNIRPVPNYLSRLTFVSASLLGWLSASSYLGAAVLIACPVLECLGLEATDLAGGKQCLLDAKCLILWHAYPWPVIVCPAGLGLP